MATERALGDDDPDQAYEHAKVARRFAARIGVVREAVGVAAYRAGHYAEALSDLRAARRLTGSDEYLPIMADCERGLGRPERALDLVRSPEAAKLDRAGRVELAIVESGARRDLGQHDAAVITLQRVPELRDQTPHPWSARLTFAYADALADAGHEDAAVEWFERAMSFDEDGETDAADRYAELTGSVIEDIEEDEEDQDDLGDLSAGEEDEESPLSASDVAEPAEAAVGLAEDAAVSVPAVDLTGGEVSGPVVDEARSEVSGPAVDEVRSEVSGPAAVEAGLEPPGSGRVEAISEPAAIAGDVLESPDAADATEHNEATEDAEDAVTAVNEADTATAAGDGSTATAATEARTATTGESAATPLGMVPAFIEPDFGTADDRHADLADDDEKPGERPGGGTRAGE
ncbi:hypothetical protein [Sphaerisporangium rubeum]|uniref:Tetratricopeptide (TPR) repeat protein n=1 Tax=Sphaerisporangium rubeum TaxID=321317 RepID=A0A7X0IE43_9ACTN|nr:tetratricopeptide (TPR) repeat protein [Sphaerisporangium rubeum]